MLLKRSALKNPLVDLQRSGRISTKISTKFFLLYQGGVNKHEKTCLRKAAAAAGIQPVLYSHPDADVVSVEPAQVDDAELAWLDGMARDDVHYFVPSVCPNSTTSDYFSYVIKHVADMTGSNFERGMKLLTICIAMAFCPVPEGWERSTNTLIKSRATQFCMGNYKGLWDQAQLFTPSEPEVRESVPRNLEHDQLGLSPSQIKRARMSTCLCIR